MPSIYILERLPNTKDSLLLQLLTSNEETVGGLFQKIPTAPFKSMVRFVDSPDKADYCMLPHNYNVVSKNPKYFARLKQLTKKYGKKMLIFSYGDSTTPITVSDAIILRTSAYKSRLLKNEVIVPAFVEDLGEQFGVGVRREKKERPVVSFAGWVRYGSFLQECKYQLKVIRSWLRILAGTEPAASYQGIFYRRQAIHSLEESELVTTNFLMRTSFSGNKKTVVGDKNKVRKEFVDSIKEADLGLSVRGDGNWSLRFYEVLSLGRIPLYVDTDAALPCEDEINYEQFTISLDYKNLKHIAEITSAKWKQLSSDEIEVMQTKAREAFENKLRADVFYQDFFSRL